MAVCTYSVIGRGGWQGTAVGQGLPEDFIGYDLKTLCSEKATFVKSKLDWDDGRRVYEVEFYADDYTEYDYEIDASTGKILSYDQDAEDYKAPSNSGSYIGEEKAKSIAVSNVKGAGTNNVVKVEFDYDDGRAVYEVKVVYNAMEYEFEIDASNGKILSRDAESIYD